MGNTTIASSSLRMSPYKLEQSDGDANKYYAFELDNGVKVLLIDDKNQTSGSDTGDYMAQASIVMNAGSFNDPPHRQGLAHFLEHMIFLGSTKYPDPKAYSDHMASNGGQCNAYTEFELSNYQFQVQYSALEKAIDMVAHNLASPLLDMDSMIGELKMIDSEFKLVKPDDYARLIQVLKETSNENHIFQQFAWGNLKSLDDEDKATLWQDLRKFYDDHYSSDRITLVIQTWTPDNCEKLMQWVSKSFSIIPNKKLGRQDFSKIGFGDDTSMVGELPFQGIRDQLTIMDAQADMNKLMLCWDHHNDEARLQKNSLTMLEQLFRNKAKGSLYALLVEKDYVQEIEVDENALLKTAFRLFTVEFDLTEAGVLAYREVLALIFEYFRRVSDEWLDKNETLALFEEYRTISKLSYDVFDIQDREEYTCALAENMLNIYDPKKLLKKVATMPVVDEYDIKDIRKYLKQFSYENCKIVMMGKGLLSNEELMEKAGEPTTGLKRELWMKTKYKNFLKSPDSRSVYEGRQEEWEAACELMQRPGKNRFAPENVQTIVKPENRKKKNGFPKRINLDDIHNANQRIQLYHLVDAVHLKPMTQLEIVLRLRQPSDRKSRTGKQITYLETARDQVMFRVLKGCLKAVVTETIGYEASVADTHYKFQSLEDVGVRITINGFSDKLLDFAKVYLDMLIKCGASQSFEKQVLLQSMQKKKESYSNSNLEADYRGHNNRDLFLKPHKFHDSYLAKLLGKEIEALSEQEDGEAYDFDVGSFLKTKILDNITQIQVLVFGNTTETQAKDFLREQIVNRFQLLEKVEEDDRTCLAVGRINRPVNLRDGNQFRAQLFWDCTYKEEEEQEEQADLEAEAEQEGDQEDPEEDKQQSHSQEEEGSKQDAEGSELESEQAEEEEDEDQEDEEENNAINIYFERRKLSKASQEIQNLEYDYKFELLTSILDENIYHELRTNKSLGYAVSATLIKTNGIHGIAFCLTSADYSPIRLQKEILGFIDNFKLTKKIFLSYRSGLVATKKSGFASIQEEAASLASQLVKFSTCSFKEIEWDSCDKEIEYLEKLQHQDFLKFYEETLLGPMQRSNGFSPFALCCDAPAIDQDSSVPGGARQFLACRTFSEKFKHEMEDSEMETTALEGEYPLCPAVCYTYMPTDTPQQSMVLSEQIQSPQRGGYYDR